MWYARAENGVELRGGGEFTFVQLRERYGFCSQAHMEVFDAEKVCTWALHIWIAC